jgi:hypothetical protein
MMSPVTSLSYELVWLDPSFKVTPQRMQVTLGNFDCVIEASTLTATPRDKIAEQADAIVLLDPLLAAWALQLELEQGWRVAFRIGSAISEETPSDGPKVVKLTLADHIGMSDSASVEARTDLPPPNKGYAASPTIDGYLGRLRDVQEGREKVSAAVYYIVDDIEHRFGSGDSAAAAAKIRVSRALLDQVRNLASRGGHPAQSRKATLRAHELPLQEADIEWLRKAMRLLVKRCAEVESGHAELPLLTKADCRET